MEDLARVFKALSDETRLKIFFLLSRRTLCVNALVCQLEVSQPAVSQHLKILKEAGLVKAEKRGYWVHYSVNRDNLGWIRKRLLNIFEEKGIRSGNAE